MAAGEFKQQSVAMLVVADVGNNEEDGNNGTEEKRNIKQWYQPVISVLKRALTRLHETSLIKGCDGTNGEIEQI